MPTRTITIAAVSVLTLVLPLQAEYTSIQVNLLDGQPDTSYDGDWLTIDSSTANSQLDLNDPAALPGTVTNIDLLLTTQFHHTFWDGTQHKAVFSGGNFSLDFDYDGSPYYIGGPISNMILYVSSSTPTLSFIAGEGLFQAAYDLPGSNNWPAPLQSSIKSLTLAYGYDLTGFDWSPSLMGNLETSLTLFPNDSAVPDPTTLLLLIPGVALLRRR